MMSNESEKALDAFLEGAEADEAHQAQEQKLFELIPGGKPIEPPK